MNRRLIACLLLVSFVTCVDRSLGAPIGPITRRAVDWDIAAIDGQFATVESKHGPDVLLCTDADGNPAHAMGLVEFRYHDAIPDGTYTLRVRFRTGAMGATAWAYQLGSDMGTVVENGVGTSGRWHYFYPGHGVDHDNTWFTHDLAGPTPLNLGVWPNSAVAASLTLSGVGPGGLVIRFRDMSPAAGNALQIDRFVLTRMETDAATEEAVAGATGGEPMPFSPVGDAFLIGVYYAMPAIAKTDRFGWDHAFMDMARQGVNFIVVSGNTYGEHWARLKHWGIRGVTSYSRLNEYREGWKEEDIVASVALAKREFSDRLVYEGNNVGDQVLGHIITDEPECTGLPEDQQRFLRAYAKVYHAAHPNRDTYLNHCDPPWYDLGQKQEMCSHNATISVNGHRILDRIAEARKLGRENQIVVALPGNLGPWIAVECDRVNHVGFGACSPPVQAWLRSLSTYQAVYDAMIAAYANGAMGFAVYTYGHAGSYAVAMVDVHGVGKPDGRWAAFGDAARDLRRAQSWPGITLHHDGARLSDRTRFPSGPIKVTAVAVSDSASIDHVVFGASVDGGRHWTSVRDATGPYEADFTVAPGTVILRAQAVDNHGRRSVFDASMVQIEPGKDS